MNNVIWDDPGQGEFQIWNTTTRLLGDYANQLPSTCTLVVYSQGTHDVVQWTMPSGVCTNNGTIELRHGGGGWVGYPRLAWEGSGTLAGTGDVFMSGAGDNILITGTTNTTLTIGADQWVHGRGYIQLPVVNQGRLEAGLSGRQLRVGGLLENSGIARALNGATLLLAGGVTDTGVLGGQPSGNLTLNQAVSLHADLIAPSNSVVRVTTATVALGANRLAAQGGQVVITGSTMANGVLGVSKPSLIRADSIRRVPPSAYIARPLSLLTGGAKTEKKNQSGNTPWGRQVANPKKILPLYWLIIVSSAVSMMAGDADMCFQKCRSIWLTIKVVQVTTGETRPTGARK